MTLIKVTIEKIKKQKIRTLKKPNHRFKFRSKSIMQYRKHLRTSQSQKTSLSVNMLSLRSIMSGDSENNTMDSIKLPKVGIHDLFIEMLVDGDESKALESIAEYSGIPKNQIAELLHINSRSLPMRKKVLYRDDRIKLMLFTQLIDRATEVFGSKENGLKWLKYPNIFLDDEKPIKFSDTDARAERIFQLLGRIEHGVFS